MPLGWKIPFHWKQGKALEEKANGSSLVLVIQWELDRLVPGLVTLGGCEVSAMGTTWGRVSHTTLEVRARPQSLSAPRTPADPTSLQDFYRVSSDYRFLAVRAGRSPLSSVTDARHAEIAISACHQGPSLSSQTRWERLCLLLCPLTQPFNAPRPEMSASPFESRIPPTSQPSTGLHRLAREAMAHSRQTKPKWGSCAAAWLLL